MSSAERIDASMLYIYETVWFWGETRKNQRHL